MPQLDFSVFPSQMFWLVITFAVMFLIMYKFIVPKTAEMINLRKQKIDGDLEQAALIKKKVEKTIDKYNKALADATEKANISLEKTKEELADIVARKQDDLSSKLKAEIEAGEKRIAKAKENALQKVEEVSAELAVDVLQKLGFAGIKTKDALVVLKEIKKEQ